MIDVNKNLTIWMAYHNESIINDYNLSSINDSKYYKLFYTNDKWNINGEHINHLNFSLSELTLFYYIWKNQIKSDIVGVCHYRRMFNYINYESINNNIVQVFMIDRCFTINNFIEPICFIFHADTKFIYNQLFNYFNEQYNVNLKLELNKKIQIPLRLSYIMKWNIFNDVCNFIFGFFDYIANQNNFDWKTEEGAMKLLGIFLLPEYKNTNYIHRQNRLVAIIMEFLTGFYIRYFYEINLSNIDEKILIYNIKDAAEFHKVYMLNLKTGINRIINKNKKIKYGNFTNTFHKVIKPNNLKEYINQNKDNLIYLKRNEYLDCIDPIEFCNGNYTIKKL